MCRQRVGKQPCDWFSGWLVGWLVGRRRARRLVWYVHRILHGEERRVD